MNISGKFSKVSETENSIVVGTIGNLTKKELTHENILYIANFYGISTAADRFHYHFITSEGANNRGCKFPENNYNDFIEYFKN